MFQWTLRRTLAWASRGPRVPKVYIGEVLGIRVRVSGAFLLLALAFVAAGMGSHAMVLMVSVLGHEMAHALASSGFGAMPREVEIYPFGGVLEVEGDWGETAAEAVVALAGPLHNLVLAGLAWWLSELPLWRPGTLTLFIETNLMLGLFNLLPVLPLDGGRVIRAMIADRLGYRRATSLMTSHGRLVAVVLILLGAGMIYRGLLAGANAMVIGGFLYVAAGRERKAATFLVMTEMARKKEILLKKGQIPVHQIMARESVPVSQVAKGFVPGRYHVVMVVDDDLAVVGRLTETRLLECLLEMGGNVPLGFLLKEISAPRCEGS